MFTDLCFTRSFDHKSCQRIDADDLKYLTALRVGAGGILYGKSCVADRSRCIYDNIIKGSLTKGIGRGGEGTVAVKWDTRTDFQINTLCIRNVAKGVNQLHFYISWDCLSLSSIDRLGQVTDTGRNVIIYCDLVCDQIIKFRTAH